MADKTVTVRPSGGTYTTLAAAIAGEVTANADLTAGGMNGILTISIEGTWSSDDTTNVNVNGFTTDATHYVNIITDTANRAGTSVDTGKYRLSGSFQWGPMLEVRSNYTRVTGLQIANAYASGGIGAYSQGQYSVFDSCLVYDGYDAGIDLNATGCKAVNCIAKGATGPGINLRGGGYSYRVYNCVSVNNGGAGLTLGSWSDATCYNNYCGGNTGDDYVQQANATLTLTSGNYSEDGTRSTSTVAFSTSTFTNVTAGSEDLSLVSGSGLIGAGTNLSADGTYPFNWDITGATRTTWDVGAVYFSSVTFSFLPIFRKIVNTLLRR